MKKVKVHFVYGQLMENLPHLLSPTFYGKASAQERMKNEVKKQKVLREAGFETTPFKYRVGSTEIEID